MAQNNSQQYNSPVDKGRIAFIAETYPNKQQGQGQPQFKNRYATMGRATKWQNQQGESIELELDSIPVGANGPVKMFIFWDSQNPNNQVQPFQPQANNNQWPPVQNHPNR